MPVRQDEREQIQPRRLRLPEERPRRTLRSIDRLRLARCRVPNQVSVGEGGTAGESFDAHGGLVPAELYHATAGALAAAPTSGDREIAHRRGTGW